MHPGTHPSDPVSGARLQTVDALLCVLLQETMRRCVLFVRSLVESNARQLCETVSRWHRGMVREQLVVSRFYVYTT
jgi:hypothetical protein